MQWNAGESVELIRTDKKLGMDKSKVTDRLTCVYTNIDGFSSTKDSELIVLIEQTAPDIVLITETKLLPEHVVTEYMHCTGYTVFRKDRGTGRGGGVLIMVQNTLSAVQLFEDSWNGIEAVVCQLRIGKKLMSLACIGHPAVQVSIMQR